MVTPGFIFRPVAKVLCVFRLLNFDLRLQYKTLQIKFNLRQLFLAVLTKLSYKIFV